MKAVLPKVKKKGKPVSLLLVGFSFLKKFKARVNFIEGKITKFSILRKLFALTILRVEFGHFWLSPRALARGFNL
jgi:hypothetical protein